MPETEAMRIVREKMNDIPCVRSLGLEIIEHSEGFVRMSARHDPNFDGVLGGFHGGMLANVADCVAWFAIATRIGPHERLVTTDLNIRYLAACMGDCVATGRVIKLGKTLCPVHVELFDTQGEMVAVSTVTYIRVDNLGGAPKN
ncbi:MAG: PaaI family thioesterase [Phycisphaerales bacterium]|nr:PaaI family thioesterase [Phycisphaerales bacterium]